ncbi:unnamed protein product [Adineta steineri]|uniref:G-protein coupled receptors family 1 profile domain-containing protein n=1 Tax=Adineta steineri TaxID=433720 RepID=A0A813RH40_9BILA|nr:unnamed protein product [Adineta steineri]CAF3700448.1 unnamed protein product [Adineta steineri]
MDSNISLSTTTISSGFQWTTSFNANRIKFIILLLLQLLSIPCFLWIFYQFARQRQLRQSLNHHVILLLLIISFLFVTIALPLTQAFLYTSYVYPSSDVFCSLWTWIHYSLNIINMFLMAFASIERNWLIFHPSIVQNRRGKVLFHYGPLIFCLLYPPLFYIAAIFIWPCENYYDYTQLLCTWPCYFYNYIWAQVDLFFNNYTPLLSIPLFCAIIYIRVLIQKHEMKQEVFKWNRDKKMILQLWAISSLYLGMWMPIQLTGLINTYWDPNFLLQAQVDYIYLFPYLIHLIYPFIVLLTYRKEMLSFRRNAVVPAITLTERRNMPTMFK